MRKRLILPVGTPVHSIDAGYDPCVDMVVGDLRIVRDDVIERIYFEADPDDLDGAAWETGRIKILWPGYKKKPKRI